MDKKGRIGRSILWSLGLLILILDSKTAVSGVSEGIELCIRAVIPSIFPFLVICSMVSANIGPLSSGFRPFGRLLRLPQGAEDLFFLGLFAGYPVGASAVSRAVKDRRITQCAGRRLLAFCSNAGPAFLFGIGGRLFPHIGYCAILWLIHISSAAIVGFLTPGKPESANIRGSAGFTLQQALLSAINTMATICGWVVLFRMVITIAQRWVLWFLPTQGQIILRGILELANGILSLEQIDNSGQRMILFSALLGFGGICVWMQTVAVCTHVPTGLYLPGKIVQSAISILLSTAVQSFLPQSQRYQPNPFSLAVCIGICVAYPFFLKKMEKRSGNSILVGV